MYNYFVILDKGKNFIFIRTNALKKVTERLIVDYIFFRKLCITKEGLSSFFEARSYMLEDLVEKGGIYGILKSMNYEVIDLSHHDCNFED